MTSLVLNLPLILFLYDKSSRRQQHYHSQRQPQRDPQQRPMSNFYEYESVQSLMNSQRPNAFASSSANSSNPEDLINANKTSEKVPKQHLPQYARLYHTSPQTPSTPSIPSGGSGQAEPVYGSRPANSSGGQRQYQRYVANHNQRNIHRLSGNRGPFITQVTIEDQTQKTVGSRV